MTDREMREICWKCRDNDMFDASGMCFECSLNTCPVCWKYKPDETQTCADCLWGSQATQEYTLDDYAAAIAGAAKAEQKAEQKALEEVLEEVIRMEEVAMCDVCGRHLAVDNFDRCVECLASDPNTCRRAPHRNTLQMCAECALAHPVVEEVSALEYEDDGDNDRENDRELCYICYDAFAIAELGDMCEACDQARYVCQYCKCPKNEYDQTCRECMFAGRWMDN